jgi:hypothetical protein
MLNITVDPSKVPAVVTEKSTGYWRNVGQRFMRDKLAMFAGFVIFVTAHHGDIWALARASRSLCLVDHEAAQANRLPWTLAGNR